MGFMQSAHHHLRLAPEGPSLALGRAHEVSGPARRTFAFMVAGRLSGPVLWITAPGAADRLDPEGLVAFFDPVRLVAVRCAHPVDALWAAEEALRAGAVALAVVEPGRPPGLTPVRRFNLAAEAGGARAAAPPLCLILTAEGGAAAAVETRWRADPLPGWAPDPGPGGGPARWRFALERDKAGPPCAWEARAARPLSPPHFARAA